MNTKLIKQTKNLLRQVKDIENAIEIIGVDMATNHLNGLTFDSDYFDICNVNDNVGNAFANAINNGIVNGIYDIKFYLESTIAMLEDDGIC